MKTAPERAAPAAPNAIDRIADALNDLALLLRLQRAPLIALADLLDCIGLPDSTWHQLRADGVLPVLQTVRLGRRLYVAPSAVRAWVIALQEQATQKRAQARRQR